MKTFIDDVVDSFVMWDLLIFFSKRAGELETPGRMAQMLGRPAEELQKPVLKLEKLGVLTMEKRLRRGSRLPVEYPIKFLPGPPAFLGLQ